VPRVYRRFHIFSQAVYHTAGFNGVFVIMLEVISHLSGLYAIKQFTF